ncbi:MAG: 2'-5' RNA ligase family protein [Reyranella sp.]
MDGLFTKTIDLFNSTSALTGPVRRVPSQLFARRGRRLHTTFGPVPAQPPATDRLFFAVLPDAETAGQIAERTARWRTDHGLRGKPLKPEHFHVTLYHVADMLEAPRLDLIDALAERASTLSMPAFRVEFDRVMSFNNGAFVLSGDESTIGLEVLQQRLSDALDPSPRPARRFVPHVTLLRDQRRIAEQPVERIGWTAREVVLVHSLLGQTTHRHVARVPLLQT